MQLKELLQQRGLVGEGTVSIWNAFQQIGRLGTIALNAEIPTDVHPVIVSIIGENQNACAQPYTVAGTIIALIAMAR